MKGEGVKVEGAIGKQTESTRASNTNTTSQEDREGHRGSRRHSQRVQRGYGDGMRTEVLRKRGKKGATSVCLAPWPLRDPPRLALLGKQTPYTLLPCPRRPSFERELKYPKRMKTFGTNNESRSAGSVTCYSNLVPHVSRDLDSEKKSEKSTENNG